MPGSFPRPPASSPSVCIPEIHDLTTQIQAIDWFQFEKIVAAAYKKQGYSVTRRGGANPDGGIDLILEKAGEQTGVQCKQWKSWQVGVRNIREFFGALCHAGLKSGIFITVRGYTMEARKLAQEDGIQILDGAALTAMLERADAQFDPEIIALFEDKRKFCPKCESEMVLRRARKGAFTGQDFWSCSSFPRCRYKMNTID
ncbi:MAG: restriction endonuclease [Verrucomicrobiota bacterium]